MTRVTTKEVFRGVLPSNKEERGPLVAAMLVVLGSLLVTAVAGSNVTRPRPALNLTLAPPPPLVPPATCPGVPARNSARYPCPRYGDITVGTK